MWDYEVKFFWSRRQKLYFNFVSSHTITTEAVAVVPALNEHWWGWGNVIRAHNRKAAGSNSASGNFASRRTTWRTCVRSERARPQSAGLELAGLNPKCPSSRSRRRRHPTRQRRMRGRRPRPRQRGAMQAQASAAWSAGRPSAARHPWPPQPPLSTSIPLFSKKWPFFSKTSKPGKKPLKTTPKHYTLNPRTKNIF